MSVEELSDFSEVVRRAGQSICSAHEDRVEGTFLDDAKQTARSRARGERNHPRNVLVDKYLNDRKRKGRRGLSTRIDLGLRRPHVRARSRIDRCSFFAVVLHLSMIEHTF